MIMCRLISARRAVVLLWKVEKLSMALRLESIKNVKDEVRKWNTGDDKETMLTQNEILLTTNRAICS
jgi:hypothetical protein